MLLSSVRAQTQSRRCATLGGATGCLVATSGHYLEKRITYIIGFLKRRHIFSVIVLIFIQMCEPTNLMNYIRPYIIKKKLNFQRPDDSERLRVFNNKNTTGTDLS